LIKIFCDTCGLELREDRIVLDNSAPRYKKAGGKDGFILDEVRLTYCNSKCLLDGLGNLLEELEPAPWNRLPTFTISFRGNKYLGK